LDSFCLAASAALHFSQLEASGGEAELDLDLDLVDHDKAGKKAKEGAMERWSRLCCALVGAAPLLVGGAGSAGSALCEALFSACALLPPSEDCGGAAGVEAGLQKLVTQPLSGGLSSQQRALWSALYVQHVVRHVCSPSAPAPALSVTVLVALQRAYAFVATNMQRSPHLFRGADMGPFFQYVLQASAALVVLQGTGGSQGLVVEVGAFAVRAAEKAVDCCPDYTYALCPTELGVDADLLPLRLSLHTQGGQGQGAFAGQEAADPWAALAQMQQLLGRHQAAQHTRWRRQKALGSKT